jgi:hypothetical protein
MKKFLILLLPLIFIGCSNDSEEEDFTPYPGGKKTTDQKAH